MVRVKDEVKTWKLQTEDLAAHSRRKDEYVQNDDEATSEDVTSHVYFKKQKNYKLTSTEKR